LASGPITFDRIEIVEATGGGEDEYFGGFMSGATTAPLQASLLREPTATLPLPAGLPLLLAGLGALALTRRGRSRR